MIDKNKIIQLVKEKLNERMFIVDVSISSSNVIYVFVDSYDGITIEQCIEISRNIEHNLDRDEEDFGLQVSSPGLMESFKVKEQYIKYTGREIEILTASDLKYQGILKETGAEEIVLETASMEKPEGQKKKQLITKEYKFKYDEIKSAKAVISFNKLMSDGKY